MKTMITKKEIVDMKGWTIPKGTTLHIIKEITIKNPMTKKTEHFMNVKIDNGSGIFELMQETAIKEVC